MKMIVATAACLIAFSAAAAPADDADVALVETEMTPLSADPITENNWDRRFGPYELENSICCGL